LLAQANFVTFEKMKPYLSLLSICVFAGPLLAAQPAAAPSGKNMPKSASVSFPGGARVQAEVVCTPEKMTRGLSNARGLAQGKGMLFLYPFEGTRRFWMKSMLFDLDIIYLRHDGMISRIFKNIKRPAPGARDEDVQTVEGYANYVLEVEAGFSDKNSLKEGLRADIGFSSAAVSIAPASVPAVVQPAATKAKGKK